jgi:hypothetical protein
VKFDPKELQELLHKKIIAKVRKSTKRLNQGHGELAIAGSFVEIDEGNMALHCMLAFLGKARLVCRAQVTRNGHSVLDEVLKASATCAWFTGPRAQLKCNVNLIATKVVKKTVKALKTYTQ